MTNRPTVELKAVESTTVRESIDLAKKAEREGRWGDACAIYEQLVRDPHTLADTRLAALRWLGRATSNRETAALPWTCSSWR